MADSYLVALRGFHWNIGSGGFADGVERTSRCGPFTCWRESVFRGALARRVGRSVFLWKMRESGRKHGMD